MSETRRFDAVIVDYGGVLTSPIRDTMTAFCASEDIEPGRLGELMRTWLTPSSPAGNPVHDLEMGRLDVPAFEALVATQLQTRTGAPIAPEGLLRRMFAGSVDLPELLEALHLVKAAGLRVGLLSNSWGNTYPVELWGELFDDTVISGEVGLRKPDPAIYELAAERLGVAPGGCVFVDDIAANIHSAVAVGMTGILHRDAETTIAELETLLELRLG